VNATKFYHRFVKRFATGGDLERNYDYEKIVPARRNPSYPKFTSSDANLVAINGTDEDRITRAETPRTINQRHESPETARPD
jgi:hypothetical protein